MATKNNFLNSIFNFFSIQQHNTVSTIIKGQNYLYLYNFLYKYLNISFHEFNEYMFILRNINKEGVNLFSLSFILFINYKKTIIYQIKTISLLKNYSVLYFFNAISIVPTYFRLMKPLKSVTNLVEMLTSSFSVRYSPSTVSKYLNTNYTDILNILFLRKNKVFNKGRYSRNRQFYRTGVYWCLYINIIAIVGLYFWFYRFVMNFGYLWWLLFLSLSSFVIAKSFNYGLINPKVLVNSIFTDLLCFLNIFKEIVTYVYNFLANLITQLSQVQSFSIKTLLNKYITYNFWLLISLFKYYNIKQALPIFFWTYTDTNYYIHSITLNYNKVFLNSKKQNMISEFITMLTK